jgi:uncharacterized surface protein with fasciclin (FAS1) repeats
MANVFDTLLQTKELEIFVTAIQMTDLDRVLKSESDFTIFAPNNRAFTSLSKPILQSISQDIPLLTRILKAHLLYGKLSHSEIIKAYDLGTRTISQTSINGSRLDIDLNDGIKIGKSRIVSVDILATNGIIYLIDQVISSSLDRSANKLHLPR